MSTTLQKPLESPAPEITVTTKQEEHRRDVFLRAAEIMERDGYTHGGTGMAADTNTPVCLLGAVGRALGAPVVIANEVWARDGKSVISKTEYDYCYTGSFVLDCDPRHNLDNPKIDSIYEFSDDRGKDAVLRVLRAMANGKTFAQATNS